MVGGGGKGGAISPNRAGWRQQKDRKKRALKTSLESRRRGPLDQSEAGKYDPEILNDTRTVSVEGHRKKQK